MVWLNRAAQAGRLPGSAGSTGVLDRPTGHADGVGGRIKQFHEIVFVGGAGIAAASVNLTDDNIGRARGLNGNCECRHRTRHAADGIGDHDGITARIGQLGIRDGERIRERAGD